MTQPSHTGIPPFVENDLAIVLVAPQGDANIGAAARAMKNFGMADLRLVTPAPHITDESIRWAMTARDVLESAQVLGSLTEALADKAFAAAFTRRIGKQRKRHITLTEAAPLILSRAKEGGAALVFGPEESGLANEHIDCCDLIVEIPTSPAMPSLNLAQSVLIACYEISRMIPRVERDPRPEDVFVPKERIFRLIERTGEMLSATGYEDNEQGPLHTHIKSQLEKIFGRAGLSERDVNMIEGLITRVMERTGART